MYPWVTFTQQSRMYDPLYGYYRTQHRDFDYLNRITRMHNYYASNPDFQPARTLALQQQHWHNNPRQNRESIALQALGLSALVNNNNINVNSNSIYNQTLQLVRVKDNERQRLQQGLDPARQLRRMRADVEGKRDGGQRVDGQPGNQPGDRQRGDRADSAQGNRDGRPGRGAGGQPWKLPQVDLNSKLGSVAIGNQDNQPANQNRDRDMNRDRGNSANRDLRPDTRPENGNPNRDGRDIKSQ